MVFVSSGLASIPGAFCKAVGLAPHLGSEPPGLDFLGGVLCDSGNNRGGSLLECNCSGLACCVV